MIGYTRKLSAAEELGAVRRRTSINSDQTETAC